MGQVTFEVPGPGQYIIAADPSLPQLENAGADADVLFGKQFYLANNSPVTGTMPNCGAVSAELNAGESFDIPYGYHDGEGKISSKSLESQTQGTATENSILSGETAWVNGQQITGNVTPGSLASDATATANTILSPYTAYVGSGKIIGTIPTNNDESVTISGASISVPAGYYAQAVSKAIDTVSQAVPSITVNSSGLITASATQDAGYVEQGTESATQQLAVQGAQTITPSTSNQTIAAQQYLTGVQTIKGDPNLLAENIKDGVSIFDVIGSYQGTSGFVSVPLIVTVTSGANVTVQNGDTVFTKISNGVAEFTLNAPGEWKVSATLNGESTSQETVTVYDSYAISLNFIPTQYDIIGLSAPRSNLAAASNGNYCIFGGGRISSAPYYSNIVDAYDLTLSMSQPNPLSVSRQDLAAAPVSEYILFGGGYGNGSYQNVIDAYNSSLVLTNPSPLTASCRYLTSTYVGEYALFGGGLMDSSGTTYVYSDSVDAYSTELVKTQAQALISPRSELASASNNGYAIFAGGQDARLSCSNVAEAYDTLLVKTVLEALPVEVSDLSAAPVGDYILFAGGQYRYGSAYDPTSTATAYDSTLTRIDAPSLSVARSFLSGISFGNYAMFGGGRKNVGVTSNDVFSTVDVYSTSLTRSTSTNLSTARTNMASTSNQQYALFGGGGIGSSVNVIDQSYVVDVYGI